MKPTAEGRIHYSEWGQLAPPENKSAVVYSHGVFNFPETLAELDAMIGQAHSDCSNILRIIHGKIEQISLTDGLDPDVVVNWFPWREGRAYFNEESGSVTAYPYELVFVTPLHQDTKQPH